MRCMFLWKGSRTHNFHSQVLISLFCNYSKICFIHLRTKVLKIMFRLNRCTWCNNHTNVISLRLLLRFQHFGKNENYLFFSFISQILSNVQLETICLVAQSILFQRDSPKIKLKTKLYSFSKIWNTLKSAYTNQIKLEHQLNMLSFHCCYTSKRRNS